MSNRKKSPKRRVTKNVEKTDHDSILTVALADIHPSPENDDIYGAINLADAEIIALAKSIAEHGLREPLTVTEDGYILSGHRRYAAAKLAKLSHVPIRRLPMRREDDIDHFVLLLREHNRQRDKSMAVKLREELINANPAESYRALREYRDSLTVVEVEPFQIRGRKQRAAISRAKQPMLDAVLKVINDRWKFWPLSDRAIHYALLNDPPLIHASKPQSRYANNKNSYRSLVDLLTRARLSGEIPFEAIADSTRPVSTWRVYPNPRQFIRDQMDRFLKGYYRDLMHSQPHHIELVCEKNTVEPILRSVASKFSIPLTSGRGYCSLPPRYELFKRYSKSGKRKLILLIASDFDPDGDEIAHSFARSMRDDFGIEDVHPIKVALTGDQVREYELPPVMTAKKDANGYDRFVDQYGDTVFELEALDPDDLQSIVTDAIHAVLELDLYNSDVEAEAEDAAFLDSLRATVHEGLQDMDWEGDVE